MAVAYPRPQALFSAAKANFAAPDPVGAVSVSVSPQAVLRQVVMEGGKQEGEKKPHRTFSFAPIMKPSISVRPGTATRTPPERIKINPTWGPLALEDIRQSLIRQEDTIIYNLIERAQFLFNGAAYDPKTFSIQGFDGSLVQYMLRETEILHAKVRRYTSPDEHAFFPDDIPQPSIPPVNYPKVLHPTANSININAEIWSMYFDNLLPELATEGDDGNYGSTATLDVLCLQALSKRIHYGKFVAESKFLEQGPTFEPVIRAKDSAQLMDMITHPLTEAAVIQRVEEKAKLYGQELDKEGKLKTQSYRIAPHLVAALYRDWVMPLTKKVQVTYLLQRLD